MMEFLIMEACDGLYTADLKSGVNHLGRNRGVRVFMRAQRMIRHSSSER